MKKHGAHASRKGHRGSILADADSFHSRGGSSFTSAPVEPAETREEAPETSANAEMLLYVRGISSVFKGFDEDQLEVLSENMSFMEFQTGQPVMQKGEQGTWFGVLLSGSLAVELVDGELVIRPGALIGEMAVWGGPNARRSTTMKGRHAGLIATMLLSELQGFVASFPEVGNLLMRMLGRIALEKQIDNMKRERSASITPALKWQKVVPKGRGFHANQAFQKQLANRLGRYGLDENQADTLCGVAQYHSFESEGEVLVQEGQRWDYILIVLEARAPPRPLAPPRPSSALSPPLLLPHRPTPHLSHYTPPQPFPVLTPPPPTYPHTCQPAPSPPRARCASSGGRCRWGRASTSACSSSSASTC